MGRVFRLVLVLSILAGLNFYPAIVADVNAATSYYVSTSGSDGAAGTIGAPWRHIDYAVDHVSPGDTIYVRGGTYYERVTFSVSGSAGNIITLTNYQNETAVVDGTGLSYSWGGLVQINNRDYITVDGLEIRDADTGTSTQAGVFIGSGSDRITINDCYVHNTNMSGIMTYGIPTMNQDITITNNDIYNCNQLVSQEAISIWAVEGFEVAYNHVWECLKEGIDIKGGSDDGTVHHNHVHDVGGPGIYLDVGGTGDSTLENVSVYNNFVHDIGDYGHYVGDRKAGISIEVEKLGGLMQYVYIYNNISGYNCNQGGFWTGNRTGDRYRQHIYVYNNTFHHGNDWGGGVYIEAIPANIDHFYLYNNIFLGTRSDNRMVRFKSAYGPSDYAHFYADNNIYQSTSTYYDDDWGGTAGTGNAPDDPELVSSPGTNEDAYYLQSTSPARDNGTSSYAPSTDYWGNPRNDGAPDIGAHEYAGSAPPPNQPPILGSIGNRSVDEGTLLQFTISATDPDSNNLTYSASNLPSGANFNTTTRVFSWTPTEAGTYTNIYFQVSDGSLTDSEDITITVNATAPPPEPPSIAFISPTDVNSTTVARDWTDVNVSVNSTIDTTSFIDWNRSLVGYWDFEENSGSSASDNSTYTNNGSLVNSPQWTTGRFGSALSFDGSNDYVDCDNNAVLNSTDEITIEAWVNPSIAGEGGPNAGVIAKAQDGVGWSWQLRYNAPGGGNYLGFQFNGNPEGATWVSVKQNLTPGIWYHVVGVFDGTNIKCYLNGIETDSNQISGIVGGNSSLFIGHDGWGNVFNGNVDEAKIWNRALSSNEIKASYNSTVNSLNRQFTGLTDGTYQYYAYTTDTIGNSVQTATRTLTIATGQSYEDWDVNQDGICNVLDMTLVGQHMGETGSAGWIPEDVNSDGAIDVLDMIVIGQNLVL